MTSTPRFDARRTRSGRVVAVGIPPSLEASLNGRVELVAPDGREAATAVLVGIGRTWVDSHTGEALAYGYVDVDAASLETTAGAA
ncbi:MAG: hypothetical protein NVV66_16415 [Cellulomonas sp.]|uniref:hypothetical protein n=1 Tax=Cellulomonas sp. TaxID=40001 RepID=UPI002589930D|nr:hypothetical protein [Cellulomonas sp.]MCR6706199.1 hypothetical protein [Cellulomonas sp.]